MNVSTEIGRKWVESGLPQSFPDRASPVNSGTVLTSRQWEYRKRVVGADSVVTSNMPSWRFLWKTCLEMSDSSK